MIKCSVYAIGDTFCFEGRHGVLHEFVELSVSWGDLGGLLSVGTAYLVVRLSVAFFMVAGGGS